MVKVAKFIHQPRTDADVRLLLDTFAGIVPDGRVITHEAIEQTLSMRRDDSRYRTVTKHWRRALFDEQRVFLDGRAAEGQGFKALTPDEMVRFSNREVRAIGRRLKRALIVAALPADSDIKDDSTRMYRARLMSATEQISRAHGKMMRELSSALRPPRQLPRAVNQR